MLLAPEFEQVDVQQAEKNLNNLGKLTKEELNTEIFNKLSHRLQAKAIYKKMDYELMRWTRDTLNELIETREAEIEAKKEKEANRMNVMEQVETLLKANNYTLNELFPDGVDPSAIKTTKRTYQKRTPKEDRKPREVIYKFKWHIFDQDYYWRGTGYLPKSLRCYLAKGNPLECCIIPKEERKPTLERKNASGIPEEYQQIAKSLLARAERENIPRNRSELGALIDTSLL